MKTRTPKANEIEKKWYLIDAKGKIVGRLASKIAVLLRGKHKPGFTPHLDIGDYVVVINADKAIFTGKKEREKKYRWYTGYPGGLRETTPERIRATHPERILIHAVKGMLPKNRLGRKIAKHLFVYASEIHPHQAQKPEKLQI